MSRTAESVAVNLAARIDALYAENVSLVYALNGKKQYVEAMQARASVRISVAELLIEQLRRSVAKADDSPEAGGKE